MSRKLTSFVFFKNTPLIDFQNTIYFQSNAERDNFFLNQNRYNAFKMENIRFNFIRDRGTVRLQIPYEDIQGVNYCTFISDFEPNRRYYAYVLGYEYLNNVNVELVEVSLMVDVIMTFCQGDVLESFSNLSIERQHLSETNYQLRLPELKNNGDVLKTNTKAYVKTETFPFTEFYVLIQSTVNLQKPYGTVDSPEIHSSDGQVIDKVTSPVNLYVCELEWFNPFMEMMDEYPWITQNFKKISLIPKTFISEQMLTAIAIDLPIPFGHMYRFMNNKESQKFNNSDIDYSMTELYDLFNLDSTDDKHLFRSEYTTTELYSWDGQQVFLDNGFLPERFGLRVIITAIVGYVNQIVFFPLNYKWQKDVPDGDNLYLDGTFLNDAIVFSNFDELPILIDNYNLALAQNANKRALTESKLITNRIENVFDSSADLKDRFFDAASILSNFSISGLFGKFTDEYEYYRTQKAEFADLALNAPTVTSQTNGNSFQIAHDIFGVTVKFSAPTSQEWEKIKVYYKKFGYETMDDNSDLDDTRSMTICNYVKFKGSYIIPDLDVSLMEMVKAQFENGVRLWHNNGTDNPMNQDLLLNVLR